MNETILTIATALWLGILTAISPCPLATNIAAISLIGRRVGSVKSVLFSGMLYTIGRMLTYALLGIILVASVNAAPQLSHILQKYMNLIMGPLLILVAMVLLGLLKINISSEQKLGQKLKSHLDSLGFVGTFLLGIVFALSFCPTSAALFFGSLLPMAIKTNSGFSLSIIFGAATGLPVMVFAFILAFSANRVAKAYNSIAKFEFYAQRITGILFLIVGLGMTLTITIGIKLC